MKARRICLVLAVSLLASPAFAQTMPDRADDVGRVVNQNRRFFGSDDGRRSLLAVIACDLNQRDGGQWGRLLKNDRNPPFMPADILVWRPTNEHVDVLTDSEPFWEPHPTIPPQWAWSPVVCDAPTPLPVPPPVVVLPPTPAPVPVPAPTLPSNAELIALVERILVAQQESLAVAKDTNVRVASMDRTLTQTLGSFSKFVGKYIAPALATWYVTKQVTKPAAEPAK